MKREVSQTTTDIILELRSDGLTFSQIANHYLVRLPIYTVRRVYLESQGRHTANKVRRYDKMIELQTTHREYIQSWQSQKQFQIQDNFYWRNET